MEDKILQNIFLKTDFRLIFLVAVLVMGAFILARLLRIAVRRYTNQLKEEEDKTAYKFLENTIGFLIFSVFFLIITYTIPSLRSIALTLFASASILAAILGFASQKAFSNIVSGIFIVIFKPFRVGDIITIGAHWGIIEDITLRHTIVRGIENRRIIIPNASISEETILNFSIKDPKTCKFIEIPISFDSDVDLALSIMSEEAEKFPDVIDNRTIEELAEDKPIVEVRTINIDERGIILRAYVWFKDPVTSYTGHYDLLKLFHKKFKEAGIKISYPHRSVYIQNPENIFREK
jgi:small-conductance mechanosensitive channel